LVKNKKSRPGTRRPESDFDMEINTGNLKQNEAMMCSNETAQITKPLKHEPFREKIRADGKTARKTKRRTL
jgi:hypothetical protein